LNNYELSQHTDTTEQMMSVSSSVYLDGAYLKDSSFRRFDTIPVCDGQRDKHTDSCVYYSALHCTCKQWERRAV